MTFALLDVHPVLGRVNRQVSALECFQARHFHHICGHMPALNDMVEKDLLGESRTLLRDTTLKFHRIGSDRIDLLRAVLYPHLETRKNPLLPSSHDGGKSSSHYGALERIPVQGSASRPCSPRADICHPCRIIPPYERRIMRRFMAGDS